jgi:hypothetical protein
MSEPLSLGTKAPTCQAILDFVAAIVTPGRPEFVPPAERIAVFDNDGPAVGAALAAPGRGGQSAGHCRVPCGVDVDRRAPAVPVARPVELATKWRLSGQLCIVLGIVILTASAGAIISPILIKYLNDNISTNLFVIALAFLPAALVGAILPSRLGG